jgi:mycothiol synthase
MTGTRGPTTLFPPPLTSRPVRYVEGGVDRSDLDAAVALVRACDLAVLGDVDSGSDEVAGMLLSPDTDRDATLLVHDGTDAVGLVCIEDGRYGAQTFVDVYADAAHRDGGVISTALALGVAAARRHREAAGAPTWTLRSGCYSSDERLREALLAHGFTHVRSFFRMRIDCSSAAVPTTAPPLPDGVTLRIARDEETRRRVHLVDNEAFLDHWNFSPRPYDAWWERVSTSPSLDPEGMWLLEVDGEPAALALLDESRAEIGDGYVAILGVRRAYRGRGLARLLLQRVFVHYRDLGRQGVALGVDAENPTGAVRLYEGVGMAAVRTIEGYALPLD